MRVTPFRGVRQKGEVSRPSLTAPIRKVLRCGANAAAASWRLNGEGASVNGRGVDAKGLNGHCRCAGRDHQRRRAGSADAAAQRSDRRIRLTLCRRRNRGGVPDSRRVRSPAVAPDVGDLERRGDLVRLFTARLNSRAPGGRSCAGHVREDRRRARGWGGHLSAGLPLPPWRRPHAGQPAQDSAGESATEPGATCRASAPPLLAGNAPATRQTRTATLRRASGWRACCRPWRLFRRRRSGPLGCTSWRGSAMPRLPPGLAFPEALWRNTPPTPLVGSCGWPGRRWRSRLARLRRMVGRRAYPRLRKGRCRCCWAPMAPM